MVDIDRLLQAVVQAGASDVHLAVACPLVARVNGALKMMQSAGEVAAQDMEDILRTIAPAARVQAFYQEKELDFSYGHPGLARFRVNACYQRGTISLCFRVLPAEVPSVEQLGLPKVCMDMVQQMRGLVLVTGATGSGKTTTLAALVNHLNETRSCRIITLEDPIEYLHLNKKCMIIQREMGNDTDSFSEGLRRALRQDPDVIMVEEMRDLESIALAITAAETGHLVLATLHTNGAAECVERLVGVFPAEQQQQILFQLSIGLSAVIYQMLLPRIDATGRIATIEVLVGTPAIRNLIRQNQISQIGSYMFMGSQYGMQTTEQALVSLIQRQVVSKEEAFARTPDRATLEKLLDLEGIEVPSELRSASAEAARSRAAS